MAAVPQKWIMSETIFATDVVALLPLLLMFVFEISKTIPIFLIQLILGGLQLLTS